MKFPRTGFGLLVILPLAAGVLVSAAQAASMPAADNCTIKSSDIDAITAAASQGLLVELSARKALLTRTIACAKADAQALQSNLNGISADDNEKVIQSQLSGRLDDAMNYYDLELGKVNDTGIAGTQGIAREVLSWRASNYDPLAAQVSNFILWTNNQPLFDTATNRLRSIEGIVAFIEQATPRNDLQSDLAGAQSLVQTANNENQGVTNAFLQSLPPGETLTMIQQSLQSLSDAYQKFFDISTIVQALLPAKS